MLGALTVPKQETSRRGETRGTEGRRAKHVVSDSRPSSEQGQPFLRLPAFLNGVHPRGPPLSTPAELSMNPVSRPFLIIAVASFILSLGPRPADDPPVTLIECGGSGTVEPQPGTLLSGIGDTAPAAKADLAGKLGLVCSMCSVSGCELSIGRIGNPGSDLFEGNGGTMIFGGSPGGPYIITVYFGLGGHCTGLCSPCQ